MEYVKRVAVSENDGRREAILSILRKEKLPFALRGSRENEHWVENIVLSLPSAAAKRMVIGAHYDVLEGSTGANDNASGVSVLLHLAKSLRDAGARDIDLVFFDREEYGDHGADAYIEEVGKDRIACMVNLDACGYGDAICAITKGNVGNPLFKGLMTVEAIKRHRVVTVDQLPTRFGDDQTFQEHGIPNIAITTLPREEAELYARVAGVLARGESPEPGDVEACSRLTYSRTMHGGALDSIHSVSGAALERVLSFLRDGLTG